MTLSVEGLRLLQTLATQGSLSAAASELGYTQSAASRQLMVLEREAGRRLVDRGPRGAQLTAAGRRLLPHAAATLEALARAEQAVRGEPAPSPLRLGIFPAAGPALLPKLLSALAHQSRRAIDVTTREGSSPSLARAVEAGRLDAALVISRPPFRPFSEPSATLVEEPIGTMELGVAAAAQHLIAGLPQVRTDDLKNVDWAGSTRAGGDPTLGVWPSLAHRAHVRFRTDDWLTRLRLVANGLVVVTVPPILIDAFPPNVVLLQVSDAPPEIRRLTLLASAAIVHQTPELLPALSDSFADAVDPDAG